MVLGNGGFPVMGFLALAFFGVTVGVFAQALLSALPAGVLSSCFAKKKVAKEEGDPGSAPAARVPCATRRSGRLAKLAAMRLKQRQPTAPRPPALLGVSHGGVKTDRR